MDHFVVLEAMTPNFARILDPAIGRRRANLAELDRMFSGIALIIETDGFAADETPRLPSRHLPSTPAADVWTFLAGALAYEILSFAIPCLVQLLTDDVARPRIRWGLPAFGAALAIGIVARAALDVTRRRLLLYVERDLEVRTLQDVLAHVLSLPIQFFVRRMNGELLASASATLEQREARSGLRSAIVDGTVALGYLVLVYVYAPSLAWIVAAVPALYLASVWLVWARGHAREVLDAEVARNARQASAAVECTSGPEMTRAFNAFGFHGVRFTNAVVERANAAFDSTRFFDRVRILWIVCNGMANVGLLAVGGRAVLGGELTIGRLMAALVVVALLEQPVSSALAGIQKAAYVASQSHRVDDVLGTVPEAGGDLRLPAPPGVIRFDRVSFRYDERSDWILRDVSFELRTQEHVALVGASGSGKTTLLLLLLGLYRPTEGVISVDGIDLRDLHLDSWRAQLGVALQEPSIVGSTVRDCVALDRRLSEEEIWSALGSAGLAPWVEALPGRLDGAVGERGGRMSGGQRQRLALAAAFARRPWLFVLDEATSSLDADTEHGVLAGLEATGARIFSVVHRAAAAEAADRVLVLDRGRIVQHGTFRQLSGEPGALRALFFHEGAGR